LPGAPRETIQVFLVRILPPLFAADPDLTFRTKEQAEAYSDAAARDWCAKNYPGWPVQPI
jgi:hypothetical protein